MLNEWLDSLRSENTKKVYLAGVRNFAGVIGDDGEFVSFSALTSLSSPFDFFGELRDLSLNH